MNVSRREYKGRLIPAGGQQDISHCQEHMRKEATKWAAVFDFEWWQTKYKDKDSIKRVSLNISLKQSIKKLIKEHSNDLSVRILPKIARLMVEGGVWWQIWKPGMYWAAIWGQKNAFWGQPPLSWGQPNYQQWATKPSNDTPNSLSNFGENTFYSNVQCFFSGWNLIVFTRGRV